MLSWPVQTMPPCWLSQCWTPLSMTRRSFWKATSNCESWKQVIQYERSIVSEHSGLPCLVFQSNREVVCRICRSSRPMLGEHVHTSLTCIPRHLPQNTGSTLCDCQMITKTKPKTMNIRSSCTWQICLRQYATKFGNEYTTFLPFCYSYILLHYFIICLCQAFACLTAAN